jgi:hypothetical protein
MPLAGDTRQHRCRIRMQDKARAAATAKNKAARAAVVSASEWEKETFVTRQTTGSISITHPHNKQ